ncbi:MAG TPA: MBOAT family O-acyltransferase [Dongiaceae bacterium]|jgi:alginate O-acetyltransferase complex protein AlgI|nr:MBOAT family O-acyltransferase [Dongiaceae bacterium]
MVFSAPNFLFLFFPALMVLHWAMPYVSDGIIALGRRIAPGIDWRNSCSPLMCRNVLLLIGSLIYYILGKGDYTKLLLASIAINWVMALWMESVPAERRKAVLALGIAVNLLSLGFFKYAGFLATTVNEVLHLNLPVLRLPLPLGISFFTFHALSYLIDIYRRNASAQRNPLTYALYILLFPQLIAGPIIRYKDIASQLVERKILPDDAAEGLRRFLIGLGKKVLIANPLGAIADSAFGADPAHLPMAYAWVGMICYTLQIYHDFSGYSDMAIGLCRMFGLRIKENFAYPYIAQSVREFWRRWHISLSTFFRDYLYIPLGGNRAGELRTYLNMIVVFFLCGLWHGASWTFVVWGLYHGLFIASEHALATRVSWRIPAVIRHLYLLLVVGFGWVLFRAASFDKAWGFYHAMLFNRESVIVRDPTLPIYQMHQGWFWGVILLGVVGATPWLRNVFLERTRFLPLVDLYAYGTLLVVILQIATSSYSPFIYFNF